MTDKQQQELIKAVKEVLRRLAPDGKYSESVLDADFEDIKRCFIEAGWVELDEDQHTPTHYYPYDSPEYYQAQRDMIRDGWVKAKKEEK